MKHCLLIIFTLLLSAPSLSFAQAAVEFPVKRIDMGTISEDTDSVSCVFQVVNTGDAPLLIEGVYVSCGCVEATHSKSPIEPGKSGTITATIFPEGYSGVLLKSLYVYTNTYPRKNVIRVKANVVPPEEKE